MLNSMSFTPGRGIDFTAVGHTLLILLVLYLRSSPSRCVQTRLIAIAVNRAIRRLRDEIEEKLTRLPLSYFDRQPRGEVLSRATNDVDNLGQSLQQTMSQVVISVLSIVGVLTMMLVTSWLLALIAIATVPLSVWTASEIGKRSKPQFVKQWAATGRLNAHIEEMYTGHQLVKAFGRQAESAEEFSQAERGAERRQLQGAVHQRHDPAGDDVHRQPDVRAGRRRRRPAGRGRRAVAGQRAGVDPVLAPVQPAADAGRGDGEPDAVRRRLGRADLPDPRRRGAGAGPAGRGDRWSGSKATSSSATWRSATRPDRPLIENLSLKVEPGQTVAIVGPTGAGKTTLVNLLMRFYDVDSGAILLDGVDIATMTREHLRSQTGMVLQDAWLFGGTIADNIAYGTDGATDEKIRAAAVATHVDHFVRTLPDGYDTVIDEEGSNVSAGEKQLITIARAFLSQPAILILDEATSSVDTRTEVLIQRAMNMLRAGRTSFVIAHRLSTIRDADLILVMENGAIVEQGSHSALLEANGAYARLYAAQFAQALAEVD